MNAVVVHGDAVGTTLYYGKGAGAEPTGSAVIADLVDITRLHTAEDLAVIGWLVVELVGKSRMPLRGSKDVNERSTGAISEPPGPNAGKYHRARHPKHAGNYGPRGCPG